MIYNKIHGVTCAKKVIFARLQLALVLGQIRGRLSAPTKAYSVRIIHMFHLQLLMN